LNSKTSEIQGGTLENSDECGKVEKKERIVKYKKSPPQNYKKTFAKKPILRNKKGKNIKGNNFAQTAIEKKKSRKGISFGFLKKI